jgi:hypothetical protein
MSEDRYIKISVAMLNDERLGALEKLAFAVMMDASRDGLSTISERRLGQRLDRSEDAARRVIRKLQATGWIETIDYGNGRCRKYRLLTPSNNARGYKPQTPSTDAGGTPSKNAPDPLHSCGKTPSTGAAQPIRNSKLLSSACAREEDKKENDDEDRDQRDRLRLMEILATATENGNEDGATVFLEREATRFLTRCPTAYLRTLFLGHLAYAIADTSIADKLAWAHNQTRRGERVRRIPEALSA